MNEKIKKIKEVIDSITNELSNDTSNENYKSYKQKIRVIDTLLHAITLIEEK